MFKISTPRRLQSLLVATGLLGGALLFTPMTAPAQADPPRHAPAKGYRRQQESRRWQSRPRAPYRSQSRYDRGRPQNVNSWEWRRRQAREREIARERAARYRRANYGSKPGYRPTSGRPLDSDRDGVPNYRDRSPYNSRWH
jgi:hypothetical protein